MEPIIKSLLDNDAYKYGMGAAVFQLYPRVNASYGFINRGNNAWPHGFVDALWEQVDHLCELKFAADEIDFLREKCPYLPPTYLEWLKGYQFDGSELAINMVDGELCIRIVGPWRSSIYWEVPLMALISELYFKMTGEKGCLPSSGSFQATLKGRLVRDSDISLADGGTRRRFSLANHDCIVGALACSADRNFVGTSNVYLAKKHGLKPIGTVAHEFVMAHAAMHGFNRANEMAMEKWVEVFQGDLGIALPDTYTTGVFLRSFGKKYAKLYDGVRHDSGDPIVFGEKVIAHYKDLGIDPASKTIVFSNSLDVKKAASLGDYFKGKIKTSFLIGTDLTNDVGVKPLNMVIKMSALDPVGDMQRWIPTVKLSDDKGKNTGRPEMIDSCKLHLGLQ